MPHSVVSSTRLDSASGRASAAAEALLRCAKANLGAGTGVTAALLVEISLMEVASADGSRWCKGGETLFDGVSKRVGATEMRKYANLRRQQPSLVMPTFIKRLPAHGQPSVPRGGIEFRLDFIAAIAALTAANVAVVRPLARGRSVLEHNHRL